MEKLIKKRRREKLGDIYEIPLPNGVNAYARGFVESLAVYSTFCNNYSELPDTEEYMFFIALYTYSQKELSVVGNRPFKVGEDTWGPNLCVLDGITGEGSLYIKGEIIPCTYEECKDLDVVSVWDRPQLIDKLMGDDKWDRCIGRPVDQSKKKPK